MSATRNPTDPRLVYLSRFRPGEDFGGLAGSLAEALEHANRPTAICYDATHHGIADDAYPVIAQLAGDTIPIVAVSMRPRGEQVRIVDGRWPTIYVPQCDESPNATADSGILNALKAGLYVTKWEIERAERDLLQGELDAFERNGDGKLGAPKRGGHHDDAMMALAMALWMFDRAPIPARNDVLVQDVPRSWISIDLGRVVDYTAIAVLCR